MALKFLLAMALVASLAVSANGVHSVRSGDVVCAAAEVDLGEVEAGDLLEHSFQLKNEGQRPARIQRIRTIPEQGVDVGLSASGREVPLAGSEDPRGLGATDLTLGAGDEATVCVRIDTTGGHGRGRCIALVYLDDRESSVLGLVSTYQVDSPPQPTPPPKTEEPTRPPKGEPPPRPPSPATGPAPRIVFDQEEVDFGEFLAGEVKTASFTFRNDGQAELVIRDIRSSCGCTVPKVIAGKREVTPSDLRKGVETLALAPGEAASLDIKLDSKGRKGTISKQIHVYCNDPAAQVVPLRVRASCRAGYRLTPLRFDFERSHRQGTSATRSVVLQPQELEDLVVQKITAPFEYLQVSWGEAEAEESTSGSAIRIDLTLTECAPVGMISRQLVVHTNSPRVPQISIPITARVTCDIEFTGRSVINGERVSFGSLELERPFSVDVEIVNHDPSIPYVVEELQLESLKQEHLKAELITVVEGTRYTLRLTALTSLTGPGFHGTLRLMSRHPSLPEKKLFFHGLVRKR